MKAGNARSSVVARIVLTIAVTVLLLAGCAGQEEGSSEHATEETSSEQPYAGL